METETQSLPLLLATELGRRRKVNPAYSLRAFARNLHMSPAQLSQIVSGKRPITLKMFEKISHELSLSPLERQVMLESLANTNTVKSPVTLLREDEFRLISDWQHFAILSLTKLKSAKKDPAWIAQRIGISKTLAHESIQRLERLGLLSRGSEFTQTSNPLRVTSVVSSDAIQKSHRQHLMLAAEKLTTTPFDARDFSTMTMAIDQKNLPRAKKAIEQFQDQLNALLEEGQPNQVYTYACQLFPVTQTEESTKETI